MPRPVPTCPCHVNLAFQGLSLIVPSSGIPVPGLAGTDHSCAFTNWVEALYSKPGTVPLAITSRRPATKASERLCFPEELRAAGSQESWGRWQRDQEGWLCRFLCVRSGARQRCPAEDPCVIKYLKIVSSRLSVREVSSGSPQ